MGKHENINLIKSELRRKYLQQGFTALSEYEIILFILIHCMKKDVEETAKRLSLDYSSITALIDAEPYTLANKYKLNDMTLVILKMIPQLSRICSIESKKISVLDSSKAAIKYFEQFFIGIFEEKLAVVCTDENFKIKSHSIIRGSYSSIHFPFREIADLALKNNSSRIFLAHNHPMGKAHPSASDLSATNTICFSLDNLGIKLIDHIIVGRQCAVSLREIPYAMPFEDNNTYGYIISQQV